MGTVYEEAGKDIQRSVTRYVHRDWYICVCFSSFLSCFRNRLTAVIYSMYICIVCIQRKREMISGWVGFFGGFVCFLFVFCCFLLFLFGFLCLCEFFCCCYLKKKWFCLFLLLGLLLFFSGGGGAKFFLGFWGFFSDALNTNHIPPLI